MAQPRVLVIRGGAIGDFILTLPAIRLLREGIAGCHLEVMGYAGIVDLAKASGLADAVRSLGHRDMAPMFVPGAKVNDDLKAYLASFNLVVSYLYDPEGFFRGNLEAVGVKTLLECPHRIRPGEGPASKQLALPLEKIALFLDEPAPQIRLLSEGADEPESKGDGPVCVLHLGSGSPSKTWPLEQWRQVVMWAQSKRPDIRFILVTGEAEEARGEWQEIRSEWWQTLTAEHWHQLSLTELAMKLERLAMHGNALFWGHDSGIGHLAAACGLPCVLLFGPTDPAVWAPLNEGVTVIKSAGETMAELSVEEVQAAIEPWVMLTGA